MSHITLSAQNPAIWLHGAGDARLGEVSYPHISDPHDVIVRIKCIGTCGSDVHLWAHGGYGPPLNYVLTEPRVLGHEASGVVSAVGSAVTTVQVGDAVTLNPVIPCYHCHYCNGGNTNLCAETLKNDAKESMLCKYFKLLDYAVHKLPEGVSLEEGAMVEPTAVAVHMTRSAHVSIGHKVVIFGAGSIGLLGAAVAKASGAQQIYLVDTLVSKLDLAKHFVPGCETYAPEKGISVEENVKQLTEHFGLEGGADVVFETTGAEICVQTGLYLLKSGGSLLQAGVDKMINDFPMQVVCMKELTVKGCFAYNKDDFEVAIGLISSGKVAAKDLITKRVDFEQTADAWEATKKGEGIKTIIRGADD